MDTLTVYLIKASVPMDGVLDGRKSLGRYEVRDGTRVIGELCVAQSDDGAPRWLGYFSGAVSPMPNLSNRSASALLLIARGAQRFAVAFGYGRHFLRPGSWVENFGLRVTLNCIDPTSIRGMERKTFDAISRLTRTQAVHDGTAAQFGVDVEQDLLRAITGRPIDPQLGPRLSGADALLIPAPKHVRHLPARLGEYHARYRQTRYRDGFAWVDHIAEVKDAKVIDALDDQLRDRLRDSDGRGISLAPPDMIDWTRVRGFRFRKAGETFTELRLESLGDVMNRRTPMARRAPLKSRRVLAVDDAGTVVEAWPLDRCIACEIDVDDDTFVRSNGRWYRIERSLVNEVNAAVAALERPMRELPPYDDAHEGAYNARVARVNAAQGFVLIDKSLIAHGGGSSRIEFCDLLTAKRQMIHVKRYSGSQTLSHLFAQGSVGANLLLTDRAFRMKLDATLPESHRVGSGRPDPRTFQVVYAIVDGSGGPMAQALPFFSRLTLRNTARQLGALGFTVVVVGVAGARRSCGGCGGRDRRNETRAASVTASPGSSAPYDGAASHARFRFCDRRGRDRLQE